MTLPSTVGATVRSGVWLNGLTGRYPAVVLGASAAQRLGVGRASTATEILVGGGRFTVVGILNPVDLTPELDSAVLMGWQIAAERLLAESLLLSALGGAGGVLLGIAVTTGYAAYQDWPAVVPAWATAGGLIATVVIGGLAGLYPAIRAARLAPTEALATP